MSSALDDNKTDHIEVLASSTDEDSKETSPIWIRESDADKVLNGLEDRKGYKDSVDSVSYREHSSIKKTSSYLSDTESCKILEKQSIDGDISHKDRKIVRLVGFIAIVLMLSAFVIVGATLSMTEHFDEMVMRMHLQPSTPRPTQTAAQINRMNATLPSTS